MVEPQPSALAILSESVYRRVLGAELDLLAPELRAYFDGGQRVGVGSGVFDVAGSPLRILKPVLAFMAWQRILFLEYARDVPFDVVNTPTVDGGLGAVRTFHFPGRDRVLQDEMRVVDGRLHDFLGRRGGFEVRMTLTVTDGRMQLRSARQWLHVAGLRIRIPALATVTVDESWSDGKQHVDVRLHTPLLGDWFRYAGHFTYGCPEPRDRSAPRPLRIAPPMSTPPPIQVSTMPKIAGTVPWPRKTVADSSAGG